MKQKVLFEGNGMVGFQIVDGEEDLKLKGFHIISWADNVRCDCCKRHISQLKPFGKAGDPLAGDFDGALALLVKTFRWDFPHDEQYEEFKKIMKEFFGGCRSTEDFDKAKGRLIEKFGQEEADGMMEYDSMMGGTHRSFECRDCIRLSGKRYHQITETLWEVRKSTLGPDWKIRLFGRGRACDGGRVRVYDHVDHVGVLENAAQARQRVCGPQGE